jgi:hypothetical protein
LEIQIVWANTILGCLDQAEDCRVLAFEERWLRRELKEKLQGLCAVKRNMAGQIWRHLWLSSGDANTSSSRVIEGERTSLEALKDVICDGTGEMGVAG